MNNFFHSFFFFYKRRRPSMLWRVRSRYVNSLLLLFKRLLLIYSYRQVRGGIRVFCRFFGGEPVVHNHLSLSRPGRVLFIDAARLRRLLFLNGSAFFFLASRDGVKLAQYSDANLPSKNLLHSILI